MQRSKKPGVFFISLFLVFFAFGLATPAYSQAHRDALPLPSLDLNRQLLIYAQGRDPSKIEKVLEAARPLTTHLKSRYGTDIESVFLNAMASQKWERMVPASRHLVYLDTLDLMESAVESLRKASPEAKNRMKAAFMNYLLLAPYLKSIDSPADEAIRGHFRHAGKL
ncbi:MAG TPA: hypothetical protein VLB09_03525, partial [Nitrospiria bacterium]|nr:hypothetical protein [Nitrospiria bacterium]